MKASSWLTWAYQFSCSSSSSASQHETTTTFSISHSYTQNCRNKIHRICQQFDTVNSTSHLGDNIKCSDVSFTPCVVCKVSMKLKPKPSKRLDGYSPKLLKHISDSICVPLSVIFSAPVISGNIPKFGVLQLLFQCSKKMFQITSIIIDLFLQHVVVAK